MNHEAAPILRKTMRVTDAPFVVPRRPLTPPSLSPELGFARMDRYRKWGFALFATVLALAMFAMINGAPNHVWGGFALLGTIGCYAFHRGAVYEQRLGQLFDKRGAESQAQLEQLADRMWELQESEERFRGLTDALGDLVIHRNREGRIVYANKVFADLMQRDANSLRGRTLSDLGIDVGVVHDAAFGAGEHLSSNDVAIQTEGGTRWFSWIELSVRDDANTSVSHRAIARDITSRKKAEASLIAARERAESASRAKSRFLATVSHEIRTPMNGIMGMAKLLADTKLTPEQETYVGAVSTSAGALLALIEDLLDYSKIEADRFEPELQAVSLRDLIDNVVELLASRAYSKQISLASSIGPDVPQMIKSDPGRVRQVLLNLIGNAVKFTDTGGVLVRVAVAQHTKGPLLVVSVEDTGPGLKPADIERIFEEFEQADTTSTRAHGGAGLGLAISRRIVNSMGGSISVTSALGVGSHFRIELPLQDATPAPNRGGTLKNRAALIVSSNEIEAKALVESIEAYGGEAKFARTVEEAIAAANGQCNTLLIGAELEDKQGRVIRALRNGGYASAEVITLIAPNERGMLPDFRAVGYSTFLARPVRVETLLRVLSGERSARAPADTEVSAQSKPTTAATPASSGHSVLIAEDNEINAMLARATLQKAGYVVDVVGNGRAAVDAFEKSMRSRRYDVVLMDLHMPVMDGLDAITLIRQHEEELGSDPVPIMVLSADSQEQTRHSTLAHGANGFLTKPLDPVALIRAVEEHAA